jgi:hypothetical protein
MKRKLTDVMGSCTDSNDQRFAQQPDESDEAWTARISRETRFLRRPGESWKAWTARMSMHTLRPKIIKVLLGCLPPAAATKSLETFLQSAVGAPMIDCVLSMLLVPHGTCPDEVHQVLHDRRVDAMVDLSEVDLGQWVQENRDALGKIQAALIENLDETSTGQVEQPGEQPGGTGTEKG